MNSNMLNNTLIIHNSKPNFINGLLDNTAWNNTLNGISILSDNNNYFTTGTYTSEILSTEEFDSVVISWNSKVPQKTKVEILGRVLVDNSWSQWLSWGVWSKSSTRGSADSNTEDLIAKINTDTLTINGEDKFANSIQYKVLLHTEDISVTPVVTLISLSLRNSKSNSFEKIYTDSLIDNELDLFEGILSVDSYSQMTKDSKIAGVMCSATSTSMVLKYHGIDISPEEVAWCLYDSIYDGFGNWTFNTAFISGFGFTTYVDYSSSINDLKRELKNGNPVIVSVRYKQPNCDKNLPIITNAPCTYTFGHIIVVKGFIRENNKEYIVVNDPAASTEAGVSLKYSIDEFIGAWSNVAYVVHNNGDINSDVNRHLVTLNEITTNEFHVLYNNSVIDMSSKNALTIMYKSSTENIYNKYIVPNDNASTVFIDKNCLAPGCYNFKFICKDCNLYYCDLNI